MCVSIYVCMYVCIYLSMYVCVCVSIAELSRTSCFAAQAIQLVRESSGVGSALLEQLTKLEQECGGKWSAELVHKGDQHWAESGEALGHASVGAAKDALMRASKAYIEAGVIDSRKGEVQEMAQKIEALERAEEKRLAEEKAAAEEAEQKRLAAAEAEKKRLAQEAQAAAARAEAEEAARRKLEDKLKAAEEEARLLREAAEREAKAKREAEARAAAAEVARAKEEEDRRRVEEQVANEKAEAKRREEAARMRAREDERIAREKEDRLMRELTRAREEAAKKEASLKQAAEEKAAEEMRERELAALRAREEEAKRKLSEAQASNARMKEMWRGVGMRIEETAPFTILAIQALMPEAGGEARSDLVAVGDVLCTVNAVETQRLSLDEVKSLILGPQGTSVTLGLQSWRTGQRYSVTVRRHWELEEEDLPPDCAGGGGLLDDLGFAAGKHVAGAFG